MVKTVLEICTTVLAEVRDVQSQVKESVAEEYETKMAANGQVTADRMNIILDDFKKRVEDLLEIRMSKLDSKIDRIHIELSRNGQSNKISDSEALDIHVTVVGIAGEEEILHGGAKFRLYSHAGRFWHVPQTFVFPTQVDLRGAFRLWLKGMPGYEIEQKDSKAPQAAPIRPFRLLDPKMLPQPVRTVFHLHWEPVLQIMSQSPTGLHIPENPNDITASQFSELYDKAFAYLKANRLSYVFNKGPKVQPPTWKISTWSKHARPSEIIKNGNQVDKDNLPQATRFNQPRIQRGKRHRTPIARPERRHASPQRKTQKKRRIDTAVGDAAGTCAGSIDVDPPCEATSNLRRETRVTEGGVTVFYGHCQISGCTFPTLDLNHHCYNCCKEVHNLCAQANGLCAEEDVLRMYCSMVCKYM